MGIAVFLVVIVLIFLAFLGWGRWRDSKYLKKKTRDVIDPAFRETIDLESKEMRKKREKFAESLKRHGF